MDVHETRHISLFALAPIPLLIYLGSQLSNKVPVDVFQRHRDTEDWVWKDSGTSAEYRFDKIRVGRSEGRIALVISLSGKIRPESAPLQYRRSVHGLRAAHWRTLTRIRPTCASGRISPASKTPTRSGSAPSLANAASARPSIFSLLFPLRSPFTAAGNFFPEINPNYWSMTTTSALVTLLQQLR